MVSEALSLIPLSGNKEVELISEEPFSGKVNYFIGSDPKGWRANVATYGRVRYREVYPGVDIVFYGNQGELEYDILVKPGSDHNLVKFECKGVKELRVGNDGELIAVLPSGGELIQRRPRVYQEIDGKKVELKGEYFVEKEKGRWFFGFKVSDYNKNYALVIDPVLVYSTYLGGGDNDYVRAIAVDSSGNAYVTGDTGSLNFPTQNPYQGYHGGGFWDVFVTKLSPSGSLIYSTYLGGSQGEEGDAIAVDSSGNAYVTGDTDSFNFPTHNAFQGSKAGGNYTGIPDVFVTKLSPSGSPIYSTYLGGSSFDYGFAIAVDSSGNAYVTGQTWSSDFPTKNAFQVNKAGTGWDDAFVTKLDSSGSPIYSTYLGGSQSDSGSAIAVDSSGNAYVTGYTKSSDFPTQDAFQGSYGGLWDVFVTKLSSSGNSLIYSTYLGGGSDDVVYAIAVDSSGNAYVTGSTSSSNFPTTQNPYQGSFGGGTKDAFVTKLDSSGGPIYSTYLGGSQSDSGSAIAVDSSGNAYVTGETSSSNFPTYNAYQGSFGGGSRDAFVTKLDSSGSPIYSTYLGGSHDDYGYRIAVDSSGNAYVTGRTASSNFPTTQNAYQGSNGNPGFYDVFVTKLGEFSEVVSYTLTVTKGGTGTGTVTSNPPGIDCGSDCSEVYDEGTEVELTAVADSGSIFAGWSGDSDCQDGLVTMDGDKTCIAIFNAQPSGTYTLTVNKGGDGSGRVISFPRGIDCGGRCSGSFSSGRRVNLVAIPSSGSTFGGWLGDCSGRRPVTSVVMTSDKSCTAIFNRRVGRR